MIQTGLISPAHDDLVCDAAFDYYGTRLATAGLDQKIKIWRNRGEAEGGWTLEDEWKAHDATICSISWAHPEFGSMIASSSFDRTVKIWEQIPSFLVEDQANGVAGASRWKMQSVLSDAKGSVRAVEFAPHVFGLKIASIASDNTLRIYECLDLQQFNTVDSIDIASLPTTPSSTPHAANLLLMTPSQPLATLDPMSTSPSGPSSVSGGTNKLGAGVKEADGGWTLSWCKDPYWRQVLAVGCGTSGKVKLVEVCGFEQRTHTLLTLDPYSTRTASDGASQYSTSASTDKTYSVTSVSWAPSCGRSYHLIATGSRDGHVRIYKVTPPPVDESNEGYSMREKEQWTAAIVGDFADHEMAVSKVEWNITGTVLSSAGNDGQVRLWKATMGSVWRAMGSISAQQVSGVGKGNEEAMED